MKHSFLIFAFAAVALGLFISPACAGTRGLVKMGTISCPGHIFDCDDPESARDEILSAANECIRTFMSIKEDILSVFSSNGDQHCAKASRPYLDEGAKVWAVCCLKPVEGVEGCKLSCTRYISANM